MKILFLYWISFWNSGNQIITNSANQFEHLTRSHGRFLILVFYPTIFSIFIVTIFFILGYREGHRGRSLPKKKGRNNLHNTPLARLSPSSEMSHNTPRWVQFNELFIDGAVVTLLIIPIISYFTFLCYEFQYEQLEKHNYLWLFKLIFVF